MVVSVYDIDPLTYGWGIDKNQPFQLIIVGTHKSGKICTEAYWNVSIIEILRGRSCNDLGNSCQCTVSAEKYTPWKPCTLEETISLHMEYSSDKVF